MLAQRADSQVIASTVREELRWGLPPGVSVDVETLLGDVGLDGLASAGTDTLSGGQLQRLAIAGALARRPALLISDESTSMLDAEGRRDVLDLLPARTGTAVVHVTHDPAEAARAHRVIGMRGGRLVDADASGGPVPSEPPLTIGPSAESDAPVVLRLRSVGHRFDAGTPWEVPALHDIDLDVRAGEGVVITGGNGSGKSTLAWVMAGLLRPTSGAALVDDVPAADAVGAVALSFQHARLQLQRPTVAEDILAASGRADEDGDDVVRAALLRVGLSEELADRSIDHLSGGQMRRVAIAGLLAAGRRVLVLDEPLAGLDRESRRSLLELLGDLRRTEGLTLVVVSHDLEEMGIACDRVVTMSAGTIVDGGEADEATGESSILRPVDAEAARRRRPRRTGIVLRAVPGMSPLHRLDPVAKLAILAVSTVLAIAIPGWVTIGLLAALVIVGTTMARLPSSVVPRLPWWVVALLIVSGAAAAIGGGWVPYVQSILLSLLVFALSLLVIWTTPVELLPSAFLRMTRPLRVLRAPVDEWAHTLAIVVRSLPLMREETRTLLAARRLRRHVRPHGVGARLRAIVGETLDLVIAVLASAGRRSVDLGRAMTRRGGMPSLTARR